MTTQTLRNALIFFPSVKTESRTPEATPLFGFHLPRWERHPLNRSDHSTGSMDQDWIRTHLP